MTEQQLRFLIEQGETMDVEFKGEERGPLSDADLVEAVVCLANRPGREAGWLLLGVEDDGRVSGARPRHGQRTDLFQLEALIASRTRPSLSCRGYAVQLGPRLVIALEVPPSPFPVSTSGGKYLRRARGARGPECRPLEFHEMQAMQATRGALDYSALVVPEARWTDLDPLEFHRFRRSIGENTGRSDQALLPLDDRELARALGATGPNGEEHVRLAGLLLFGTDEALRRLVPTHEVAFQEFDGTLVRVNDFFRWPLLRVAEELLQRFRARVREQEITLGLMRLGIPDYSETAFREAFANAISHRDYSRMGAVHVQWHADRLEFSNPGGFPEGVRLDNLLTTPPRPRNPLLVDALKRAGLVERTARGVDTLYVEQLRNGRPAPSYAQSTDTDVVLVLPGGQANLEFVRLIHEQAREGSSLGLSELLLLNQLWSVRRLTTSEGAALLQRSEGDARARLQQLVERGLVEARGEGKARTYHLSAATYRRLGQQAAYVRQKGFTPLQQEQMVLQYVRAHGLITRAQAADLCQLTPPQAYRLLKGLVDRNLLATTGSRGRAVHYQLRETL